MTLTCDNPTKVTLKYTSIIPNKIQYSGKTFTDLSTRLGDYPWLGLQNQGTTDFFTVSAPNLDTEITWNFEFSTENSWYRYPVTVTHAGTENDPSTTTYNAYFPGTMTDIGFWFNENGSVYWKVGELTTTWVKPGWTKVDNPINGTTSREILDISIGEGKIHNLLAYGWIMNIYFDGNYATSKIVRSSEDNPPDNNISILEGQAGDEIIKDFPLTDTPEKVELIQLEASEYSWKLVKVISENVEEDLLYFSGIEPTLLCFVGEGQCPENTCPVLCGETICCYGADGISVTSLLKAESIY